jgi:transposase-like protein
VTQDDLLYRFRLRTFAIAAELGNVRAACRAMGIHPSTYYRWQRQLDRYGPEILRPRERRTPRMANATSPLVEQRVVAFALGLWVPESRSWVLSCEFVGEPSGRDDRRMTLRLLYLLFCQVMG